MTDMQILRNLADTWGRRAIKLDRQSVDQPNRFKVKKMLAESNTLNVCAAQLRNIILELEESWPK